MAPSSNSQIELNSVNWIPEDQEVIPAQTIIEPLTGTLDPLLIEHKGSAYGLTTYSSVRTDTVQSPTAEVLSPVGGLDNTLSADCTGGYFLVGEAGAVDFGSPAGTISLWLKFDLIAPNGRFWGQDYNFETRWASNRLTLDWGADNTLQGLKSDWEIDHWYFIAITWNQNINSISIYWGDEEVEPVEDFSTDSWFGSAVGFHTENNIMNSAARSLSMVDGHIDDFRYYNVQRSIENLQGDYLRPTQDTENSLVHWFCFEDDFSDSIGSSNLEFVGDCTFNGDVVALAETWLVEQVEINVMDIENLYALNGTFEDGNPGTNVDWSSDGQYYSTGWLARREILSTLGRQRAAYIDTDTKYLLIENEGYEVPSPTRYQHFNGTKIYWYQDVDNSQLNDQFEFSMKYNYQNGPIGTNHSNVFKLRFEILDGSSILWAWSIDPTNISLRRTWYTIPQTYLSLPDVPATFQLRVSLNVNSSTSIIEIAEDDENLSGDSANGMFIGFLIDDVSLTPIDSPSCGEVDLEVNFPQLGTFNLHDCNGGGTLLVNHSYWEKASIPFSFSSNSSISFDYSAKVRQMKKYLNSSSGQNLEAHGVSFSVESDAPVELSLYTYVESYPKASDLGFLVHFPYDWENIKVENPFGNDVTDSIIVTSDYLEIPSGFVDSVGWWKIYLESPNYLDDLRTQSKTSVDSEWHDTSLFYSNERIRGRAIIGSSNETIDSIEELTYDWYNPSGVLWSSETIGYCNDSMIFSDSTTIGPVNATIGIWQVTVMWTNGTVVAYGSKMFQVHHRITVFPNTPRIEIQAGEGFTAAIYVYDQDNGNPILSDATVTGNWSTTDVTFSPNLAKGWFEADFNTSSSGTGDFTITIQVSLAFYETSTCSIEIHIPAPESLFAVSLRAGLISAAVLLALLGITSLSRRFYMTTTAKRNLELLALQGRLEDAKNLIGVLVIHRANGLPLYSRIFKGVFQEALLGSFISAISHFRSEFSMDEPIWTAIPITEVVTAVQTENLICAVVTVESISSVQKSQLEAFGREIGGLYDHDDQMITEIIEKTSLSEKFDSIFDSYFEGDLIQRYVGVNRSLPENLSLVSKVMSSLDIDHGVSPEAIIKAVIRQGHSERRAYQMVLAAIDGGYMIAAPIRLPKPADKLL